MVQAHCDDANAQVVDLSAELGTLKQTFTHAETNQPVSGLELPSPVPPWKTDLSNTGVCIDRTRLIAASVRLQLENAHQVWPATKNCSTVFGAIPPASDMASVDFVPQETKRLKRLFAPKKKFAIDTTAPTNGLPQFPIGMSWPHSCFLRCIAAGLVSGMSHLKIALAQAAILSSGRQVISSRMPRLLRVHQPSLPPPSTVAFVVVAPRSPPARLSLSTCHHSLPPNRQHCSCDV